MKSKYKIHFKVMASSMVLFWSIFIIGFALWDYVYVTMIKPIQKEYEQLLSVEYTNVVVSSSPDAPYDKMKKLNNIITFSTDGKERQNVNTYVFDGSGSFCTSTLDSNEIAISEKMAQSLKVDIGDLIYADYPIYDAKVEYTIKEILPYASDMYDVLNNQDFSYVIVGDDGTLFDKAQGNAVYYLQPEQYEEYLSKEYSYSARYSISEEIKQVKTRLILPLLIMAFFMGLFVLIALGYARKIISCEVIKYYYDGFGIQSVKIIDRSDHLLFCGIPLLCECAWLIFSMSSEGNILPVKLGIIAALFVTVVCDIFVGGYKYGKAD